MTTKDEPDQRRNNRALAQPDKLIATRSGPRRYVTVARAAQLSGYSECRISDLTQYGVVARRKEGRYLYVCLDDLQSYISHQAQIKVLRAQGLKAKAAARKGERP